MLLGGEEVPDQTSIEQTQQQFKEEAEGALKSVASTFEEEGAEGPSRLVVTSDRFETIGRAAAEEKCDAILIPRPSMKIGRVLLSLRGLSNAERIAQVTARLTEEETTVRLLHAVERGEATEDIEENLMKGAKGLLAKEGINEERIEDRSVSGRSSAQAVGEMADRGDLVVIGESDLPRETGSLAAGPRRLPERRRRRYLSSNMTMTRAGRLRPHAQLAGVRRKSSVLSVSYPWIFSTSEVVSYRLLATGRVLASGGVESCRDQRKR